MSETSVQVIGLLKCAYV